MKPLYLSVETVWVTEVRELQSVQIFLKFTGFPEITRPRNALSDLPVYRSTLQNIGPNSPTENTAPFIALRCESAHDFASGLCCQKPDPIVRVMGEEADPDGPQGKFYLLTNEKTPMAKDTPQGSTNCQWIDFI